MNWNGILLGTSLLVFFIYIMKLSLWLAFMLACGVLGNQKILAEALGEGKENEKPVYKDFKGMFKTFILTFLLIFIFLCFVDLTGDLGF